MPTNPSKSQNTDTVDAGAFGAWVVEASAALRSNVGSNVPCGDCVGCCVSSYFIPIRPHDSAARAAIPEKYLVTAPGQPNGHSMLGYLADGSCPMLSAGKCTIYGQRPQTCRDYDCRIFAAAGIDAGDDKAVINRRVQAWRFTYESEREKQMHAAMRTAARFIRDKRDSFPGGRAPTAATGIAVLAFKTYTVFMQDNGAKSDEDIAMAIIYASGAFDAAAS